MKHSLEEAVQEKVQPISKPPVKTLEKENSQKNASHETPIVRFLDDLLLEAVSKKVSDIHFEPYKDFYRVRFRRDGLLYETATPPSGFAASITARLKVLAQLDIAERRLPQDGHFSFLLSPRRSIDCRISTCPTVNGEKVVLRLLDPAQFALGLDELGLFKKQKKQFKAAITQPQGMVIVTGPTGCGKTITLYSALHMLNEHEKNISTIEDPVEMTIRGINQVNVNVKAGLDFSKALRCFLRQDPDIIMVGEIRDSESAQMAIKASQTGHLVLSTLHTNSAAEALSRLRHMEIAPFDIAASVSMVVAQRLVRKLCPHCKVPSQWPKARLEKAGFSVVTTHLTLFAPGENSNHCEHCKDGYKGRLGIFEVLPITTAINDRIMKNSSVLDIEKAARQEGMMTLRQAALQQVKEGSTSLEEANRIIKARHLLVTG